MLLYGKNSIQERLKQNPKSIKKIFLRDNFSSPEIEELVRKKRIPFQRLSPKKLDRLKPAKDLQGIVAEVDEVSYVSFDDVLDRDPKLPVIFLDRINDPQNLGVIIRTVACFGPWSVVVPRFKACPINETVLHVASGGENHLCLVSVSNISNAVIRAKKAGYWILGGLVSQEAKDINQISLPFPLGLVLGCEADGIRYGIQKHLDIRARIPMEGASLSLNVAMACAIFCYEIARQGSISR
jgi:23S rRNA (guanosine2251-2'-O)-methyltransferase